MCVVRDIFGTLMVATNFVVGDWSFTVQLMGFEGLLLSSVVVITTEQQLL
jgi:enoyl reductase-like protein